MTTSLNQSNDLPVRTYSKRNSMTIADIEGVRHMSIDQNFPALPTSLLSSWKSLLYILKTFGFYPAEIDSVTESRFWKRFHQLYCCHILIVLLIIFNLFIFGFVWLGVHHHLTHDGPLHFTTVSSIITALLPLQNVFNLFIFLVGQKIHRQLLQQMDFVDSQFTGRLDSKLRIRPKTNSVLFATTATFLIPFVIRFSELFQNEEQRTDIVLAIFTLILVPVLRVWQLLPLFYFEAMNSCVRFWFKELNHSLQKDKLLSKNSLNFYYKQFLQVTVVVYRLGRWLNSFIFFSIAFSLVSVCLAIYFLAQNEEAIVELQFKEYNNGTDAPDVFIARYHVTYASLQVVIATVYILTICITGRRTNEEARKIMATALTITCRNEDDRFAVIRFVQKMNCQYYWGVTVWRTFPIERGLLFSLTGGVLAYAIILMKLKKDECLSVEIVRNIISNCTCTKQLIHYTYSGEEQKDYGQ